MRPLLQPDMTSLCTQACIAMVAGVSLEEACRATGISSLYNEGVRHDDLRLALDKLGVRYGRTIPGYYHVKGRKKSKRLVRVHRIPDYCIAGVHDLKTMWAHAVVIKDGQVYDPGIGFPLPVWFYENYIIERASSRRYKFAKDAHKRVRALWMEFLPILTDKVVPPPLPPVPSSVAELDPAKFNPF